MKANLVGCYAAVTLNGARLPFINERLSLQQHILEAVRLLATVDLESRDFSSIELRFSKRPITELPDEWAGLDLSGVIVEGSDEHRALILGIDPTGDRAAQAELMSQDLLAMEYMSINSQESADKFDPATLAQMRQHMTQHWPHVNLRW